MLILVGLLYFPGNVWKDPMSLVVVAIGIAGFTRFRKYGLKHVRYLVINACLFFCFFLSVRWVNGREGHEL